MTTNPINYWYQKYLKEKLTWEDIADIDELITEVSNSYAVGNFDYDGELETFYEEVLKRFNEYKRTKK